MRNVSKFRFYEFCFFLFFCYLQEYRSLYRMTSYLFYVLNAEQWNVFVFLELIFRFLNWFLNFKNQECLFLTVFLTLCPYSSHSGYYHSIFVLAPTLIFGILIFSVVKMNDFSFFLDFRHFFGLQLISFNIRQYLEFDSKFFSKNSTYDYLLQLSSGLDIILNDFFPLNILLLMYFLWSILFLI